LAGSAFAGSTFLGSSVADAFTIGAEGSTYNGNAGNDSFIVATAVITPDGATDLTVAGGIGTDTLQLTTFSAVTDLEFTNVTGMEKLVLDAVTTATTVVSATGIGAAAKAAFPDGMTVTSGTLATGTLYTFGAGLYDKPVNLTLVASTVGTAATHNISITTGTGADTVSVTAASFVGAAANNGGTILVKTGAGNDTIYVETSTQLAQTTTAPVSIVGGLGADTITSVGVNVSSATNVLTTTYVVAAGDSLVTAYDSITGFDIVLVLYYLQLLISQR